MTHLPEKVRAAFAMTAKALEDPEQCLIGHEACDAFQNPVEPLSPHAVRRDASSWFRYYAHLLGIPESDVEAALYELRVQLAYFGIGQEFFRKHRIIGSCILPSVSTVNDTCYENGPAYLSQVCASLAQQP